MRWSNHRANLMKREETIAPARRGRSHAQKMIILHAKDMNQQNTNTIQDNKKN